MSLNGFALNSSAPLNGGPSAGAAAATSPVGQTYFAEVLTKTDFPSFVAFANPPVSLVSLIEPASTTIRFAFRFSAGGPIRVFTGTDWQALVGDPIVNGMTGVNVNSLTPANMITTGGFDTGTPYLQLIVYMRTTDTSAAPSISGVNISFIQGTGSIIVWANNFSSDVPVQGSPTPVPAGTYIWDLNGGYRLEDGITDTGNVINYRLETQDFMVDDNVKTFLHGIEIDLENGFAGQTMTASVISDDAVVHTINVTITNTGRQIIPLGALKRSDALNHRVRLNWQGNNVVIHKIGLIYEDSGRSRP